MIPLNEKIWMGVDDKFLLRESKDPTTGAKKIIMRGLMMPKGVVSRNNVLYNWESVKDKHDKLVGRPVMYNHSLDSRGDVPFGHFIESYILEDDKNLPRGFENVYKGPGWYYAADIDPEERDIVRKLERGDLRHVSIQLIGDSVDERYSEERGHYQEAIVGDILEGSIVPSPGFLDTTAAVMAEAFGKTKKEDMTTTTAAGAIKPTQDLDKKEEYVEPAKEEDVDPKELEMGIKVEMEHTDNPEEAKKIALQHLAEKPNYYSLLNKYVESFKVTFIGPDKHQYYQKFKDEKELKKFQQNNPHLVIVKKVKERVGADPTQPLMEETKLKLEMFIEYLEKMDEDKRVEFLEEFSKLEKEEAIKLMNEILE